MKNPLVSIIIPTFNRAHLLGETLDSVMAQTYQNWECIVVDDGSTDTTDALMAEYIAKDSRFQYHHRPQDRLAGGNAARNYGFEISNGAYINWLDSDDLLVPNKLFIQVNYLLSHKTKVHLCQGQVFTVAPTKEIIMGQLWPEKFPLAGESIRDALIGDSLRWPSGTALWSRKAAALNLWDEKLVAAQEWTFHIVQAFSLSDIDFACREEVLIHIRKTESSITQNPQKTQRFEAYLDARIHVLEFLIASNHSIYDEYFKSVYKFSLRYVKYLVSVNSFESVDLLAKLIARSSFKKHLEFKFGVLIFKFFHKDYFLKRLL